jgi:hypothetical protein
MMKKTYLESSFRARREIFRFVIFGSAVHSQFEHMRFGRGHFVGLLLSNHMIQNLVL